jgi:polyphenol oxidase
MTCPGAAFSTAADRDLRHDADARLAFAASNGISERWATARQVHGRTVVRVDTPGDAGEADALFTTELDLPVAVFTADCFPVTLHGSNGVGVAHAGWRGAAVGVVPALRHAMTNAGIAVERACIGPGIGACCFEVGPEVLERFPGHHSVTTWGTASVDLPGVLAEQLGDLEIANDGRCTRCGEDLFSFRRNATRDRMAAVAWLA